ncbi:MAG: double-strand break repair protein AddB, partial [Pseudomonadota bacterium]
MAGDGNAARFVETALTGLDLIEASDDTEEALLAAILMRETLETPNQTAALVTPDAGLARRVSAMLRRWEIDVAPSAGLPLAQSPAGSLLLLAAKWLEDVSHPAALMALLQHPLVRFERAVIRDLDKHVLRGPRVWQDWPSLMAHSARGLADPPSRGASISNEARTKVEQLLGELQMIVERLTVSPDRMCTGADWFESVARVASEVALPPHPWAGEDGAAVSRLLRDLADVSEPLGPQAPQVWNELFEAEALSHALSVGEPHPRLAIWGPLEARLQTADRLILAGLNEGVWPEQPAADAFLPRLFRTKIGLSDPDERIGLSAHDFAQLACAPQVMLLSSKRRDDKPAISARWIWRLKTLARGALKDAAGRALAPAAARNPLTWLTHIERPPSLPKAFSSEPRPCPSIESRPSKLSVTRIEQLVRDPYAIYCESVLRLRPLDPLNLPPDVRVQGTAIHKALERFELERTAETPDALLEILEEELRAGGVSDADLIALRHQRLQVCGDYLVWRAEQSHELVGNPYTEERGELTLQIDGRPFILSGTADRIERRAEGLTAILDFKSGKPPSEKQVRAGLSPQMPLQGLIAREGGYGALGKTEIGALTYIRFGTQFGVIELGSAAARGKIEAKPVSDLIQDAQAGLVELLTAFANPNHPYLSAPRPERIVYESAYSRLARRNEWTGLSTHD